MVPVRVTKRCEQCNSGFSVEAAKARKGLGRFCSVDCRAAAGNIQITCPQCKSAFRVHRSKKRTYCSQDCSKAAADTKVSLTCQAPRCGRSFRVSPAFSDQKFCSLACRGAAKTAKGKVDRACEYCKAPFLANKSEAERGKAQFCSTDCRYASAVTRVERSCSTCGDSFTVQGSRADEVAVGRFCSVACFHRHLRTDEARARAAVRFAEQLSRKRITGCEAVLHSLMDLAVGAEAWKCEHPVFHWVVDAAVPELRVAIQADGDYWHGLSAARSGKTAPPHVIRNIQRDRAQDDYLTKAGWTILRLWESELLGDPERCLRKIRRALGAIQ
ncbi:endonuclease domain-containing protein [Kitasatospora griseola]|uniref:endonuclease domain-containing protein n=1 Tax=Kitasatospora griseola TaxID=2064 RepID=UPI003651E54E